MTIKGELTCECHVKELKPSVLYKRESYLFLSFYEWSLFPFMFNLIIPLCFGNTAVALVPIKHGELNWKHTHTKTERERERKNKG